MKALFSHYKKLHLWLLANLALLSAFLLARRSRGAMNALTEGFTNPLRRMLGRLCECVPFSVSEGLYVLAAMGFLAFLVLGVRAVVRSRHRSGTVYALVLGLGNAVLTVYVLFCRSGARITTLTASPTKAASMSGRSPSTTSSA